MLAITSSLEQLIGTADVAPEDPSALQLLNQEYAVIRSALEHELQEVKLRLLAQRRNSSAPNVR